MKKYPPCKDAKQEMQQPSPVPIDWERLERIKTAVHRMFNPHPIDPNQDFAVARALSDPLARDVLRALQSHPLFARKSVTQAPGRDGLISGDSMATTCFTFSHSLQRMPKLTVVPDHVRARVRISEALPSWKTAGSAPIRPLEAIVHGGGGELIAAGAFRELFMLVRDGAIELTCGDRRELLEARSSVSAVCVMVWCTDEIQDGLPSVQVRALGGKPASLLLIGATDAPFDVETIDEGERVVRRDGGLRASVNDDRTPVPKVELEKFDASIGPAAREWVQTLPEIDYGTYRHRGEVEARQFAAHTPISFQACRRFGVRVLRVHGDAPESGWGMTPHRGDEVIIPLQGGILWSYLDQAPATDR
jgi:hypothetical protein